LYACVLFLAWWCLCLSLPLSSPSIFFSSALSLHLSLSQQQQCLSHSGSPITCLLELSSTNRSGISLSHTLSLTYNNETYPMISPMTHLPCPFIKSHRSCPKHALISVPFKFNSPRSCIVTVAWHRIDKHYKSIPAQQKQKKVFSGCSISYVIVPSCRLAPTDLPILKSISSSMLNN
jgi:hypothetical protein